MKIIFHRKFDKTFQTLNSKVKEQFYSRLKIFEKNPFNEQLRNHGLKGKYNGKRSIDITGDYRAIFEEKSDGNYEFVEFIRIGTHSQLYI